MVLYHRVTLRHPDGLRIGSHLKGLVHDFLGVKGSLAFEVLRYPHVLGHQDTDVCLFNRCTPQPYTDRKTF